MALPIVILGAGGHAKVVLAAALEAGLEIGAVVDKNPERQGVNLLGYEVTRQDEALLAERAAILAIGDNRTRQCLASVFHPETWVSIIHPRAWVHPSARIGKGTLVCAGAVIQPDAVIGEHAIINTGAIVEHDCKVGDFAHIAPAACLAGAVEVDEGSFIGLRAGLVPGVRAGPWSIVGAGACVIENVPPGVTVMGVPARSR